jgi:MFS family permease
MFSGLIGTLRARQRGIFYGWWIAVAGTLINALSSGFYNTGFTVYFLPLSRDLNLSHTATSVLFAVSRLEGGIQDVFTGYLIDKWGPRIMMVVGAIIAGVGFMLLPLAHNFGIFMLIYVGVISVGIHSGFNQGTMAAVNRWFVRRRGLAFGIISVGFALGGAVITPVVAIVVLKQGWQTAALWSGIVLLVTGIPLSLVFRGSPEEMGILPDGDKPKDGDKGTRQRFVPKEGVDYTAREAFGTFSYWFLAVAIMLRIAAHTGIFVHIVPLMVWKGLSEEAGAWMVSLISFCGIGTRLAMGWWGDRWSRQKLTALAMVVGMLSMVFLLLAPGKFWAMALFGIVFSVTDGAASLTWALIGDFFGRRSFATLRGVINLVVAAGSVTTPIIAGWIFDTTQSYYWAIIPFSGIYVVTTVMFIVIRAPKYRARASPAPA